MSDLSYWHVQWVCVSVREGASKRVRAYPSPVVCRSVLLRQDGDDANDPAPQKVFQDEHGGNLTQDPRWWWWTAEKIEGNPPR